MPNTQALRVNEGGGLKFLRLFLCGPNSFDSITKFILNGRLESEARAATSRLQSNNLQEEQAIRKIGWRFTVNILTDQVSQLVSILQGKEKQIGC